MALARIEQYELWADLSVQNRHLRRNNWVHWAGHILLLAVVVFMALRPLVAIRVDTLGQATLVDAVQPANQPGPEEAEHLSRLVSQYLLEVNSGSVSRDIGKALGLMTVDFASAYSAKVHEDKTLPLLEKGNIRTALAFDGAATEVKVQKEGERVTRYFVTLLGELTVSRADLNSAPLLTRTVVIRTTLLVVPRSPTTLNGLLIDYFEKTFPADNQASPTISATPLPESKP